MKMSYFAYDRFGASFKQPDINCMKRLIASVATVDSEHPDVSLNHETGWSLSYFGSSKMVFENAETGEGPWNMPNVTEGTALQLWMLLSLGQIAELKSQSWSTGY